MKIQTSHNRILIVLSLLILGATLLWVPTSRAKGLEKTAGQLLIKKDHAKIDKKGKNNLENTSLHVISDKMVVLKDSSVVDFIGNVKATREDVVLLADSIKVYLSSSEEEKKNTQKKELSRVKKLVSTGHVEYTSGERKAFADRAVYTTADEILILTGKSPKLLTGTSWVTGKKITLFRKDNRALVESDEKTRVQAFFNPKDNQ